MAPQAIRDAVVRRARQAEVDTVMPHDLRRSFVSDLLDAKADVFTVTAMAGHASCKRWRATTREAGQPSTRQLRRRTCPLVIDAPRLV